MRQVGELVLARNQITALAGGMPGAVARAGLAHQVLPLKEIGGAIVSTVQASTADLASWQGGP